MEQIQIKNNDKMINYEMYKSKFELKHLRDIFDNNNIAEIKCYFMLLAKLLSTESDLKFFCETELLDRYIPLPIEAKFF